MCGLTGWLTLGDCGPEEEARALLRRMGVAIRARGPDSSGVWLDRAAGIGLSHRRLAIVELSDAGHQPMASGSGRYQLAYNGEIYNHLDLRASLAHAGHDIGWRGHSDTETLAACFDAWGIDATLKRSVGMFAMAVWDRAEQQLTLARDRLGEKPLYWGWQGGNGGPRTLLFGSELRALQQHPAFTAPIDRNAMALLLRHNYIGEPYSIFCGIYKLEPGCWLQISRRHPDPRIGRYWSGMDVAIAGQAAPLRDEPTAVVDQLEQLLKNAVRGQMMSDVPLGAFLSGGIDSSTVVALMQAQSSQQVRTFSIGFHEPGYNEADHAKAVAAHLGTRHTELYVSPAEAQAVVPKLASMYCEPFSDSSQIPTFLVSHMARQHVTVALSGDGGDELFSGYGRYRLANHVWRRLGRLPSAMRHGTASLMRSLSPEQWNRSLQLIKPLLPGRFRRRNLGDTVHKAADVLGVASFDEMYLLLVSHWAHPEHAIPGSIEPSTLLSAPPAAMLSLPNDERMMLLDLLTYLPGDILTKVDRAAMHVSLETRVPLLDHRVVEFAWRVPQSVKTREGISKWPLRQVLYRHVPAELIDRPKMGFGVPLGAWLRGPLREWAEELLSPARLTQDGYFDAQVVRRYWDQHQRDERNWMGHLWDVLMFQAWLEENRSGARLPEV